MSEYPEHEKLAEIRDQSQSIGDFLDSLGTQGLVLGEWGEIDTGRPVFFPTRRSIQSVLAVYFGIDERKLENEKRQMLESIRKPQSTDQERAWCPKKFGADLETLGLTRSRQKGSKPGSSQSPILHPS